MRNTPFRIRPSRFAAGLAIVATAWLPGAASAQGRGDVRQPDGSLGPSAGPAEVTIKIRRKPDVAIHVTPRGVGVCQSPNADCGGEVVWRVHRGQGLEPDEYLVIRYKSTGPGASRCFTDLQYELDATRLEVTSGPVQAQCAPPTVWFYTVELRRRNETSTTEDDPLVCPILDPGVLIDRGGG